MTAPTVLLVEDSRIQAAKCGQALKAEGWRIEWAPSAEDALTQLNRIHPDLIVSDYHMPGMDGDELCRRIRMNVNFRSVPIIMLTVDENQITELRGLESGADEYLPKKADYAALVLKARTYISKGARQEGMIRPGEEQFKDAAILAVDDSRVFLKKLAKTLSGEGYRLDMAMSGSQALDLLSTHHYDCVLIDLVMPGMDGIELTERIMTVYKKPDNPLVVMMLTANDTNENLAAALKAGADDFVGKAHDAAILKARIKALLRRKFFNEENRHIIERIKAKEMEAVEARARQQVAEARAAMAVELDRSNKDLEQFAYAVSHDLKAPLRGIGSLAQWLQQDLAGRATEDEIKKLHLLVRRVDRLGKLIDGILKYSRVSRTAGIPETVDLKALIADIIDTLAPPDHIRIDVVDPLPSIHGDRYQLTQLFQNLLSNAITYCDKKDGQIRIHCSREGDFWQFAIADNGIGIERKHYNAIFQLFRTIRPVEEAEGTGIGLAIVKKIVNKAGGSVSVAATPGKSTVFTFTWPCKPVLKLGAETAVNLH